MGSRSLAVCGKCSVLAAALALALFGGGAPAYGVLLEGPFVPGTGSYWLVNNGGFEDHTGDPTNPSHWSSHHARLVRSTDDPYEGVASLKGSYQGTSSGSRSADARILDGTQWVLSGFFYNYMSGGDAMMDLGDIDPGCGYDPTLQASRTREHYQFGYIVFDTNAGVSARARPYIQGVPVGATGSCFFDQIALTPLSEFKAPELAANKIHNPGFEKMMGARPADWNLGTNFSSDTSKAHSGDRSLQHADSGWTNASVQVKPAVAEGKRYVLSGWIYKEAGAGCYIDLSDVAGDPNIGVGPSDQWAYTSKVWTCPTGLTSVNVRCVAGANNSWFDDVSFIEYPEAKTGWGENRIANAGFEVLDNADEDLLFEWDIRASDFSIDFDEAHGGDKSLRWDMTSGTCTTTQGYTIPVEPGAEYVLSGWIRDAMTGGKAYFDLADVAGDLSLAAPKTGEWEYVSGHWFAPAGVTSVNVRCVVDSGPTGGNVWFDDVSLARVPEPATMVLLAGGLLALVRRRRPRA